MRPRSDAGASRFLNDLRIEEVTRPHDRRLGDLADLLLRTFGDPNSVLGLDRIQQFLSEAEDGRARRFHVLVAEHVDGSGLVGASLFSYVARSNCGFSEYLVVDAAFRQRGLGRILVDRRKAILDSEAVRDGRPACNGLFIEVDSPWRTPADLLAMDSIDPFDRLAVFAHLGFRRVAVAYVQPPLAPGKAAVEHMDLLFAPWSGDAHLDVVASEWVLDTLEAIWSAWTPDGFGAFLVDLRRQLRDVSMQLVDPLRPD
jgi:GNAT superfamily N-acetyltransferase